MNNDFIKRLTDIVDANLANEKFGVEDLVREKGLSHSCLHRMLKTSTNQTISQFIREIRLKKAKELLLNQDLTVSEISYRVGFGSPTYFNKCFHEYFGYPPGEARNHEFQSEPNEKPIIGILSKSKHTIIIISLIISLIIITPIIFFLISF
jgi:AraC-like DNA-binding protein